MAPETRMIRIMIVDDEESLMRALCNTLKDHGYESDGFTRAGAALDGTRCAAGDSICSSPT